MGFQKKKTRSGSGLGSDFIKKFETRPGYNSVKNEITKKTLVYIYKLINPNLFILPFHSALP